jgi:hypothetical protein
MSISPQSPSVLADVSFRGRELARLVVAMQPIMRSGSPRPQCVFPTQSEILSRSSQRPTRAH